METPAFKTFISSVADKVYGHRKVTLFHCHSCFQHYQTVLSNVLSLWRKNGGNRKRWCKTKLSKGFRQFLFSFTLLFVFFEHEEAVFHLAPYRYDRFIDFRFKSDISQHTCTRNDKVWESKTRIYSLQMIRWQTTGIAIFEKKKSCCVFTLIQTVRVNDNYFCHTLKQI